MKERGRYSGLSLTLEPYNYMPIQKNFATDLPHVVISYTHMRHVVICHTCLPYIVLHFATHIAPYVGIYGIDPCPALP